MTYEWKTPAPDGREKPTGTQTGFIAQDVEPIFPTWVGQDSNGFKTLTISPREFQALEVEAFKTLKLQNDELRDRVKSLEGGRNRLTSGFGEGGIGLGMFAMAGAIVFASSRRKRTEARS